MKTVPGRCDGHTVELLEDVEVNDRAYVLVTFLDPHLEVAVARRGSHSIRDVIKPPQMPSPSSGDVYRRFTVGALMTREIISMPPSTTVDSATHLMRARGITSLVVQPDEKGEWGIVTMRDILKQIVAAERPAAGLTLGDIASRPLIYVAPDMSLRDCARLLLEKNIRRAVVKQGGQPVGIISDTDIFLFVEERGWGTAE